MNMKIDYEQLFERAQDDISHSLPDPYEVDDTEMGEDSFTVRVFDTSSPESSTRPVDSFRFGRNAGETDTETMERFWKELDQFIMNWRDN